MLNFEVGDHIKFAGAQGEITKVEEHLNDVHLFHIYTREGQLRKLPSGLPHIEKIIARMKHIRKVIKPTITS